MGIRYKDAGVDIEAGAALVERIKPMVNSTKRPEVLSKLGAFAGACAIPTGYAEPILISGTDGVGTKLKTAFATGIHNTVGIDLVAMCVNDVIVTGAEPLFFLDYFASGKLDVDVAESVISGIADGCRQAGCALVGGETAELPGMYANGEYDLAGFCVGVAEKQKIFDPSRVVEGDVLIGIASSGLHSNGHSLARKATLEVLGLAFSDSPAALQGQTLGEAMLTPTKIYAKAVEAMRKANLSVHGLCHVTGGGLTENIERILSPNIAATVEVGALPVPDIFPLVQSAGIEPSEMHKTFNMGIGMVVACPQAETDKFLDVLTKSNETAAIIGQINERGSGPPVMVTPAHSNSSAQQKGASD